MTAAETSRAVWSRIRKNRAERMNRRNRTSREEEEPVSIVTDLRNCTLSQDDLTDDTLHFYARIENGTDDMYLRIMLQNSETAQSVLTASGQDYAAKLAVGRNVLRSC